MNYLVLRRKDNREAKDCTCYSSSFLLYLLCEWSRLTAMYEACSGQAYVLVVWGILVFLSKADCKT